MKAVLCLAVAALLLGSEVWPKSPPSPPLVGFSYSPLASQENGRDPVADLRTLLRTTDPDLVRLPVYWDLVEPAEGTLDFSSVDRLLAVIQRHNVHAARPTRVVLTVGARNFLYPELHEPAWAGPREQPDLNLAQTGAPYQSYFDATLIRYRSSPLLYAWQIENEPLDDVVNPVTGEDQIDPEQLTWEIDQAHLLDPGHDVVVTTYDGVDVMVDYLQVHAPSVLANFDAGPSGHPLQALAAGDALGLDAYVDGPSVPFRFTSPDLRSAWKEEAIDYWVSRAHAEGKPLWLTEMQAQPWAGETSFKPGNLVASAVDYREEPLQVVLLWGVDTWLKSPAWMTAATQSIAILRA